MPTQNLPPVHAFRRIAALPVKAPAEALEEQFLLRIEYDDPEGESFAFSFQPSDGLYLLKLLHAALGVAETKVDKEIVHSRLKRVYGVPDFQAGWPSD